MLRDQDPIGNITRSKKGLRYWLSRMCVTLMVLYGAVLSGLIYFENQLVFPGSDSTRGDWNPSGFKFEEVVYQAHDGTKLVGWFLEYEGAAKNIGPSAGADQDSKSADRPESQTVVVFHGNAENVAQAARRVGIPLRDSLKANVLIAEYRGFGKSEGAPTEAGILLDAEAAMRWVCQRTSKSPSEVILFGHSLGGGPACYLAGTQGCRALLLDRTFDSLVATAQSVYPIFPVRLVMKNTMRSDVWIQQYCGPVCISHGQVDTLIPLSAARNLFDLAPTSEKRFLEYENYGHWDAFPKVYWTDIAKFLESTAPQSDE